MESQEGKLSFTYTRRVQSSATVSIVGSCPELGNWNPEFGAQLTKDIDTATWKSVAPIRLKAGQVLEYKYVFREQGHFTWEPLGVNRSVIVSSSLISVEDRENSLFSKHYASRQVEEVLTAVSTSTDFFDPAVNFNFEDSVIIASMLLPVQVRANPDYRESEPGSEKWLFSTTYGLWLPALFDIAMEHMKFKWVGHPGYWTDDEEEQAQIATVLRERYHCYPVFLSPALLQAHAIFCSDVLFPIFHNIIQTDPVYLPQYTQEEWEAYRQVNARFGEKITEQHTAGQLTWVNDYQLLLVPSFISRRSRDPVDIGFYFHTPFPSSEVFKILPHREALLHSMLCCDLLGFHLFEYARHFLTSCKRLFGAEQQCTRGGYLAVEFYGRHIMVRVGHLGVEPRLLQEKFLNDGGEATYQKLEEQFTDKIILVGIDPLQYLSGIALKLNAFKELFQELSPNYQDKVVLLQVLTPARHSNKRIYELDRAEIMRLSASINSELGREVVILEEKNISRGERLGYLKAASAIIVTTIADGLNLLPLEFITIKSGGTVVLSEFAGVSRAISSPIRVNAFNTAELKEAIYDAITSGPSPHKQKRDQRYIQDHTTETWAINFLSDLKKARKDASKFQYVLSGQGDQLKLLALGRRYSYLDSSWLSEKYRSARNRVFFFDSEGTISDRLTASSAPVRHFERNLGLLEELSKDDRNSIFIVSGRERNLLELYYRSIKNLGLVSEHGALVKMSAKSPWELVPDIKSSWKTIAIDAINLYVARTEGSVCEVKDTSAVFQYQNADPEYGDWQAKELVAQLDVMLKDHFNECEVGAGKGYVEVKPKGVDKGTILRCLCSRVEAKKGDIDFIFSVGDDVNDEAMFRELTAMKEDGTLIAQESKVITCSIGKKPTLAQYYVNDSSDLTSVLETLSKAMAKVGRYYSHIDLRRLDKDEETGINGEFQEGEEETTQKQVS